MRFSIVVPVYNVEKFLPRCLDSIIGQTFADFECILVDDGSTDNSGKICDDYAGKDSRLTVIHKENRGLISARRVGISRAKGEFTVSIDSDDYVELDLLETVNSYLGDSFDMAIYSFQYDTNGVITQRKNELFADGTVFEGESKKELYTRFVETHDVTAIWIKAIRTSILQGDPMDYEQFYRFNMSEDILQSLYPLTAAQKIIYIKKPLCNYRINENSVSRSFRAETIKTKTSVHVYNAVCDYLPKWGIDTVEMREKLKAKWFDNAIYTFCNYFESATDKKEIVDFDWDFLIPADARTVENPYNNKSYNELYCYIKGKKYGKIKLYFAKKNAYKAIKKLKMKIK